jgi:amidophosphoribosyltransferase
MSGFFGCVSKTDCVSDVFYGTDYHSHLGTKRAGVAFFSKESGFQRAIHSLEDGYFRNKFQEDIKNFRGESGIGIISDTDAQPIILTSHLGRFGVVTACKIQNIEELAKEFISTKRTFSETSQGGINPTELVAMLIAEGDNFTEGINNVIEKVKGSCSMLVLTDSGIIAVRDKLGRTPVIIGRKNGSIGVAFETSSFLNLNYNVEKFLGPGEIVIISSDGYQQLQKPKTLMQICSFLWIYFGYPPSFYEEINVDEIRYRCGASLARKDNTRADFVAGIPDSGVGHAIGYSHESSIPLKRPYAKYTPTWPRSFMPQNQDTRDLVAKMKLIPNTALIKNKTGIFLDDSIVRGTQLKDNVEDLYSAGIKDIHVRIACPPLTYPCPFLNFSRSRSDLDLATRKAVYQLEGNENPDMKDYSSSGSGKYIAMVEQIRKNLNLTTLKYQELEDMVSAIGLPKEKLCLHCWNGSGYF